MKTPEQILQQEKYKGLKNLVLICEAMEEFADQEKQALKEEILLRIKRIEEDNFNIQNVYGAGGRSALNSLKDFIEGKVL